MAGTGLLYSCTNPVVASLGLFNIFLYAGPYTYSKQKTELNTWIGAVVGAVPPVMGWAAASGGSIWAMEPAALAAFLYLWQFPHFFALMWMHRHDYAKGGFKMVSLSDPNGTRTSDLIMKYTLYSTALPIAVSASGMCSWMFAVEGTALNMVWLYFARKFQNERTTKNVRDVFRWSLVYILLGLSGMVFHANSWKLNQDDYYHWAAEKVMTMRAELSGKCVHEILAYRNVNTAASDTVEGKLDSDDSNSDGRVGKAPSLCLKLKTEEAVSSAATVPAALGSKVAIAAQKNRSSSSASNVTPQ
jgi:protoheme IX farnesyltransferase